MHFDGPTDPGISDDTDAVPELPTDLDATHAQAIDAFVNAPESYRFPATLYRDMLHFWLRPGTPLSQGVEPAAISMLKNMQPRDPMEEALIGQMIWLHARIAFFSRASVKQKNLAWSKTMNANCNAALTEFRLHFQALSEHRRPRRRRSFTAIQQANIASQQVISNRQRNYDNPILTKEMG